jgi:hypothetical protein
MSTQEPSSSSHSTRQRRSGGATAWTALALAALLLGLTGCTTYRTGPPQNLAQVPLLAWLQVGKTTREELRHEWGPPSASLQQGRFVFYRLEGSGNGLRFSMDKHGWYRSNHSLVLIFDTAGVLETNSLVRTR